jgi:hypothetical protein
MILPEPTLTIPRVPEQDTTLLASLHPNVRGTYQRWTLGSQTELLQAFKFPHIYDIIRRLPY